MCPESCLQHCWPVMCNSLWPPASGASVLANEPRCGQEREFNITFPQAINHGIAVIKAEPVDAIEVELLAIDAVQLAIGSI